MGKDSTYTAVASIFETAYDQLTRSKGIPHFKPGGWESINAKLSLIDFGRLPNTFNRADAPEHKFVAGTSLKHEINPAYTGVVVRDLYRINFPSLVPHTIVKLSEEGVYPVEPPFDALRFVMMVRMKLKIDGGIRTYTAAKVWINYWYGMLPKIGQEKDFVTGRIWQMWDKFKIMFDWVYIDIDSAFILPGLSGERELGLVPSRTSIQLHDLISENFDFPNEVEEVKSGIFFKPKKFIIETYEGSAIHNKTKTEYFGYDEMPHV